MTAFKRADNVFFEVKKQIHRFRFGWERYSLGYVVVGVLTFLISEVKPVSG